MNKFLKLSVSGIMISGLLIGCSNSESSETTETKEEVKSNTVAEEVVSEQDTETVQSWEDVNGNLGEWITESIEILEEDLDDPRIEETNYDEGFTLYLKSEAIRDLRREMNVQVEGEAIEKDLNNLFLLHTVHSHNQFVRTSHLGHNGEAIEATELFEQWEPTPEIMRQGHEYMKQLLHDLDVAANHGGEGETYGVTYTLNGDKTLEVENNKYWNGGGE